jgi:hypothetical protein
MVELIKDTLTLTFTIMVTYHHYVGFIYSECREHTAPKIDFPSLDFVHREQLILKINPGMDLPPEEPYYYINP